MTQRVCVALVRMMVFGSAMALAGRGGVLHFDEAWVAMSGGAEEVQRLGRLARSQNVLPILYTQRVSDLVNNDLTNFISRGIILAITDPIEAEAACRLFKLDPTSDRLDRIQAKATASSTNRTRSGAPNYNSLRALFIDDPDNPGNRKNIRGSIGMYCDIQGREAEVEIRLPEDFLRLSSTTPADIERREKAKAARLAADKARAAGLVADEDESDQPQQAHTGASALDSIDFG